jgi:hypothetical protein
VDRQAGWGRLFADFTLAGSQAATLGRT